MVLNNNFILALNEKIIEFKFSSIMASLAEADIFAVYKKLKWACNTEKSNSIIQIKVVNIDKSSVNSDRTISWNLRRIRFKLIACINIIRLFIAGILPQRRHVHLIKLDFICIKIIVCLLTIFKINKIPFAGKAINKRWWITFISYVRFWKFFKTRKRNKIRARDKNIFPKFWKITKIACF